jgi:hypothetical protein
MRIIKDGAERILYGADDDPSHDGEFINERWAFPEKDTIEISDAQLETIYYGYKGYFDAVVLVGREPITFPQYFGKRIISLAGEGK